MVNKRKYSNEKIASTIEMIVGDSLSPRQVLKKTGIPVQTIGNWMTQHFFYKNVGTMITLKSKV